MFIYIYFILGILNLRNVITRLVHRFPKSPNIQSIPRIYSIQWLKNIIGTSLLFRSQSGLVVYVNNNVCLYRLYIFIFSKIDLLAELQFSYICFLLGLSYESFERWKKLFQLFCMSKDAVAQDQTLFAKFLLAVRHQLETVPEDFLVDIVENNNVVYNGLKEFFRILEISDFPLEDDLRDGSIQIKRFLDQKFGWEFNELDIEDDDEAPVIVNYTED